MLSADENDAFAYAITAEDKAIGSIGAFRQENINSQTAELGYYLAEDYWGKGIMTDAICQLCQLIFETTDILRIYAEPFAYNVGSRRALEKAGFLYEGLMRCNAVKNGKVVDMTLYSLTRSRERYPIRRRSQRLWSYVGGCFWNLKHRSIPQRGLLLFVPVWMTGNAPEI